MFHASSSAIIPVRIPEDLPDGRGHGSLRRMSVDDLNIFDIRHGRHPYFE
jgi:hypothetical protein